MMATTVDIDAGAKRRLRFVVETYYDVQEVRMEAEHRILSYSQQEALEAVLGEAAEAELRRMGTKPYKAAIKERKEEPAFVAAAEAAIHRLEDDEHHKQVNKLMRQQETILKNLAMRDVREHPLWTEWLRYVYGIGPCLAGGLMAWIDITKSNHCSQLWKYMGLAVSIDKWLCHACRNEVPHHSSLGTANVVCPKCQNKMAPVGHADRREKGKMLGYNPRAKTLAWKIGESFVKQSAAKSGYRRIYDGFRAKVDARVAANGGFCSKEHRDEDTKKVVPCFDAHKFAMAKRLTVKIFTAHVYLQWRKLTGLPTSDPFVFWGEGMAHDRASMIDPIYDRKREEGPAED